MLNRLYTVAVILGVAYCGLEAFGLAPTPERKFYLFAAVGLIALRFVVRLPTVPLRREAEAER